MKKLMLGFGCILLGLITLGAVFMSTTYITQMFTRSYYMIDDLPAFVKPTSYNGHKHNAIIRLHEEDKRFFCSGFVVSDEYAVTAGHCVDGEMYGLREKILIYNDNKEDTGVIAVGAASNRRGDTGLIKGNFKEFDKFKLLTDPNELYKVLTETVIANALGFPYGASLMISGVAAKGSENFHLAGKALLYPGMSGGPLVSEDGIVIGVNSYVNGDHVAFSSLIGLLDSFKIKHD